MSDTAKKMPIALVYRMTKGCRQYPFFDVAGLVKWLRRRPYCGEWVKVIWIDGGQVAGETIAHALTIAETLEGQEK